MGTALPPYTRKANKMYEATNITDIRQQAAQNCDSSRKGKQIGNPRVTPAYCLEKVCKPHSKGEGAQTEPQTSWVTEIETDLQGGQVARICKVLDQRKGSWTERGILKSAVGSPRPSDKFQSINMYVR